MIGRQSCRGAMQRLQEMCVAALSLVLVPDL